MRTKICMLAEAVGEVKDGMLRHYVGIGNDTATRDIHAQDLPWNGVFDDTLFADGFDD